MQLTAVNVADYIRKSISLPMYDRYKLLKLVYFSQAWHLAWTGRPIFSEPFEAWPKGPVERNVFREAKYNELVGAEAVSGETAAIIDAVLEFYGSHNGDALVDLSHEDEPWMEARQGLPPTAHSTKHLDPATLRDYYVHRALMNDGPAPVRPAVSGGADDGAVASMADRAVDRWRGALAILAER